MTPPRSGPEKHQDLPPHVLKRIRYMEGVFPGLKFDRIIPHLCLLRTVDLLIRAVGRYLKPYGLTPPAMGTLIGLDAERGPMSMSRIREESVVSLANITGIVDTLEKRGYARRKPSRKDRRVTLVEITPKGRRTLHKLMPGLHTLITETYSGLSRAESEAFCMSLHKVMARIMGLGALLAALLLPAFGRAIAGVEVASPPTRVLSLQGAVRAALERNPSLEAPRAALDQALAAQLKLLGAYDTSLTVSLRHLDSKTPPTVFFLTDQTLTDSASVSAVRRFATGTEASATGSFSREKDGTSSVYTLNPRNQSDFDLSLTQPLLKGLIGLPERASLRASEASVRAARADLEHAAERLARRTAAAYWELWRSRRSVGVARSSQKEAVEFLATTRKLFKRFEAEKDDLLRAEADVLRKKLDLLTAEERVSEHGAELRVLLAPAPGATPVADGSLESPPEPAEVPAFAEAKAAALAGRRDLASRKLEAESARYGLAATAGSGLPSLDLTGSLGWTGLKDNAHDSLDQLNRMGWRTWSVGLSLSYPFGNRADRGERLAADAARKLAAARTDELSREIEREVAVALERLRLARSRVGITRELERMQDEVLEISRKKYSQGRITSRDRLLAADAALAARSGRLEAAARYATALAEQKAAGGSLLDWLGVPRSAALRRRTTPPTHPQRAASAAPLRSRRR